MKYIKDGDRYILQLKKGELVIESLIKFAKEVDINTGEIRGIGAICNPGLAFYNSEAKNYITQDFEGDFEILSLMGNFSLKDDEVFPHLHIVLGKKDFSSIGGHLRECRVSGTLEIFIAPLNQQIKRAYDEETALHLWDLK